MIFAMTSHCMRLLRFECQYNTFCSTGAFFITALIVSTSLFLAGMKITKKTILLSGSAAVGGRDSKMTRLKSINLCQQSLQSTDSNESDLADLQTLAALIFSVRHSCISLVTINGTKIMIKDDSLSLQMRPLQVSI